MKKRTKKVLLSIRIPTELNKQLDRHVAAMGLTKSSFVLTLINQALAQKNMQIITGDDNRKD